MNEPPKPVLPPWKNANYQIGFMCGALFVLLIEWIVKKVVS